MTAPLAPARPAAGETAPVKIVRVIARLNTGGPAIHAVLLSEALNGARFHSLLVTGHVAAGEGDMSYFARAHGVRPVVLPELGTDPAPWSDLKAVWRLYRLFLRQRPDIIHTHTTKAGALGRLAGLLYNASRFFTSSPRGAKLVHSFHGHVFHAYFRPWQSRLLVLGERLLACFTDRIIAVSEQVRRDLTDVYRVCPPEKTVVVPLGLDFGWTEQMAARRGALRRAHGVPADVTTVGIVGRLTAIKHHELFLAAARRLARPDVRFLVIGDGERRGELERLAAAPGLEGRVVFTGWERDTAAIYGDLDIVCLTSLNEGTPVALIEATAAGRPFVATRVGGVADLVRGAGRMHPEGFEVFDNGVLVAPGDVGAFASALAFLVDHPEVRRSLGASWSAAVREQFSKDRLCRDVDAVYAAVLGRPTREVVCAR